jgi:hypothetical protein
MSQIYAAAQLTIIAAAGDDPSYGLPGVRPGSRQCTARFEAIGDIHVVVYPATVIADVMKSTWNSRAWTYQEAVSSKRKLFFTDRQILYACNLDMHCEAIDNTTLSYASLPGMFPNTDSNLFSITSERRAIKQIKAYSRRKLTYDTDALNAILDSSIISFLGYQ